MIGSSAGRDLKSRKTKKTNESVAQKTVAIIIITTMRYFHSFYCQWTFLFPFLILRASAMNRILYGGALVSIDFPTKLARIEGSFRPDISIELFDGPVADAVRADPISMGVCSSLDGLLVRCVPLAGDGIRVWPEIAPESDEGFGFRMHSFQVWLARKSTSSLASEKWDAIMQPNATVVFSSQPPSALHMPDNTEIFFAQCDSHRGKERTTLQTEATNDREEREEDAGDIYDEERDGSSLPIAVGVRSFD